MEKGRLYSMFCLSQPHVALSLPAGETGYLYHFSKLTLHKRRELSCSNAGQDAPPTEKENEATKTSYALIFKRNGISSTKPGRNPAKDGVVR